jgi:LacI family transcriptional regulator
MAETVAGPPGRPTLRTIAEHSGVHYSTVSRVLRGEPQRTSAETKERVLRAAKELGYRPDYAARALVTKRTQTLGLLVPDLRDPVFSHLYAGADEVADARGFRILVSPIGNDGSRFEDGLSNVLQRGVDGLLDATAHHGSGAERATKDSLAGVPYLQINRYSGDAPRIVGDDVMGGRLATEHLVSLGHTRIGFVGGDRGYSTTAGRLGGYLKALEEHGIDPQDELQFTEHYQLKSAADGARRLLELPDPPTAIFVSDDSMALAVIRTAWEMGCQTPQDLSVVGYNNVLSSAMLVPSLTTVDHPLEEIGRAAVRAMLEVMAGDHEFDTEVVLPVELVVRESTAEVRQRTTDA